MPPTQLIDWADDNCANNPSRIVAIGRIRGELAFTIEDQHPNGYALITADGDIASNHFFDSIWHAKEEARRQVQQHP